MVPLPNRMVTYRKYYLSNQQFNKEFYAPIQSSFQAQHVSDLNENIYFQLCVRWETERIIFYRILYTHCRNVGK